MSDPLQFRKDLPIVGQPLTVVSWFPTVQIVCNCDGHHPMLLIGINQLARCPGCGQGYQIHGVRTHIATEQMPHFDINIVPKDAHVVLPTQN